MATQLMFSIVVVLVSLFFFGQGNAYASITEDMALIESVCKKTQDYKLCVSTLKSNPRSFKTDVKGLARIMVEVTLSKVDGILRVIHQLRKNTSDSRMQECLDNVCYPEYDLSTESLQDAIEHLQSNSFLEALTDVDDAYIDEQTCEDSFAEVGHKSPMTPINTYFAALCRITEDIIRILME